LQVFRRREVKKRVTNPGLVGEAYQRSKTQTEERYSRGYAAKKRVRVWPGGQEQWKGILKRSVLGTRGGGLFSGWWSEELNINVLKKIMRNVDRGGKHG